MNKLSLPTTLRLSLETMNSYGIWTGGANSRKMTSLNATSFIGGIRFWAEALLRAQGLKVCSKQSRCNFDKKDQDATCDACKIFGCTGISRAFSMQIENVAGNIKIEKPSKPTIRLYNHSYQKNGKTETPEYYLVNGYTGSFSLKFVTRRPDLTSGKMELPGELLTALLLMIKYGTFGAYDQYGCGLVNFEKPETAADLRELAALPLATGNREANGLSLKDFFFFKGTVPAQSLDAVMGEIRCIVRETFHKKKLDDRLRHWFCGSMRDKDQKVDEKMNNAGTKYVYSVDSKGRLYGWGHFARNGALVKKAGYASRREDVLGIVHDTLRQKLGQSLVWKEFGAPTRDAASPRDWPSYLGNLVENDWRTL